MRTTMACTVASLRTTFIAVPLSACSYISRQPSATARSCSRTSFASRLLASSMLLYLSDIFGVEGTEDGCISGME